MPRTGPVRARPVALGPTGTALKGLFGGVFGGDKTVTSERDAVVLATYTIDAATEADASMKLDSLTDFLTVKWVGLFRSGTIQLTTPVEFVTNKVWEAEDGVDAVTGVQLIFKPKDSGYKKDQGYKKDEGDEAAGEDKSKDESPKEGGVEILVEKLANSNKLRVRARRCEVDEGTIIKEMSEETIISELSQAVDAWKKEAK